MSYDDWDWEWSEIGPNGEISIYKIFIPKGTTCDGTSIPTWASAVSEWMKIRILRDDLSRGASFLHDWLYKHQGIIPFIYLRHSPLDEWVAIVRPFTRLESDDLFKKAMHNTPGLSDDRIQVTYDGVRKFGQSSWDNHASVTSQFCYKKA
jgi:hypothetical protein